MCRHLSMPRALGSSLRAVYLHTCACFECPLCECACHQVVCFRVSQPADYW
ncbi:hypothetical protein PF007_g31747 [Phytophthora fragariae]|uniref:Uncharacterized protein n=2 Tax=Phytophthora TaxID=4783 RepID=A0A6A3INU6_9STRA|nr:hypothetical protein PF003_g38010 [Phytophthora fragariae]KAE8969355.1 hypothetical protein PR002_g27458 [Phytophthora rubi]KAE8893497.1 hypothetical protein PF003_g22621 [Phytophthora fragariae]KAE8979930.1 hypothetical protein PR001_g24415 [Phytophthora rubi]KAE8983741.1 hypothetical protein PR001_g23370 [Phytophthora rubi]